MTIGRTRVPMFVFAVLLSGVSHASAAILVPPGLNAGDPYHLVFVSSTPNTANFGGIVGADAYVQALADAAGIGVTEGVTWQALLSDSSTDAITRFNPAAPIYNMNGDRVAANGAALWNTAAVDLENPISFDENGTGSTTILVEIWTGTNPSGTFDTADSNWVGASANTSATAGSSISIDTDWINGGGSPTEIVPLSVFATSDLLIATTIPEPSTFVLAALGLISLLTAGRRRRNPT